MRSTSHIASLEPNCLFSSYTFKLCLFGSHFTLHLSTLRPAVAPCPGSQPLLSCNSLSYSLLIIAACWKTHVSYNMATVCKKHQKNVVAKCSELATTFWFLLAVRDSPVKIRTYSFEYKQYEIISVTLKKNILSQ